MQSTMLLAAAPAPPAWLALEAQLYTALSSSGIKGARKLLLNKHLQPEVLQPPQLPGEHVLQGWARQKKWEGAMPGARQPRTLTYEVQKLAPVAVLLSAKPQPCSLYKRSGCSASHNRRTCPRLVHRKRGRSPLHAGGRRMQAAARPRAV